MVPFLRPSVTPLRRASASPLLIRALHGQFPPDEAAALAVDNAITFYVAGHETTANALAWTAYCLAAQPELQEDARAEAIAALALPPADRAAAMPLLLQILEESLRLYPPVPRWDREALGPDELGSVLNQLAIETFG